MFRRLTPQEEKEEQIYRRQLRAKWGEDLKHLRDEGLID